MDSLVRKDAADAAICGWFLWCVLLWSTSDSVSSRYVDGVVREGFGWFVFSFCSQADAFAFTWLQFLVVNVWDEYRVDTLTRGNVVFWKKSSCVVSASHIWLNLYLHIAQTNDQIESVSRSDIYPLLRESPVFTKTVFQNWACFRLIFTCSCCHPCSWNWKHRSNTTNKRRVIK
jgi:hypothetical protein